MTMVERVEIPDDVMAKARDEITIDYWTFRYRRDPSDDGSEYFTDDETKIPNVVRRYAQKHTITVPARIYYDRNFKLAAWISRLRQ
jgi:hypothetical protein